MKEAGMVKTSEGFKTPPPGGAMFGKDDAVLDRPAELSSLSGASSEERDAALKPPDDGHQLAAEALSRGEIEAVLDKICPMCGWNLDNRDVAEPNDEDKTNFVLAALSNQRFRRTYEAFGGRMKITLRNRTYLEMESLSVQLTRWRKKNDIQAANQIYLKTWLYNMLISLEAVEIEGKEPVRYPELSTEIPDDSETESPLELAERRILDDWNETIYSVIQNYSRHFDQVVQQLTLRVHDSDFWPATATPA